MFDPSTPEAARWRTWLSKGLSDAGIPADAMLELQVRPVCGVSVSRVLLDLRWGDDAERHTEAAVLVPHRRLCGTGWSGWPAYLVGVRLLRTLG